MNYEKQGLSVDEAHLESYAENLARGWKPLGETGGKSDAQRLRRTLHTLKIRHDALSGRWGDGAAMPGAVRWVLDNHYLARREGLRAAAALQSARRLRYTAEGSILLLLCRALVRSGRYELSPERIARFLRGAQRALILERSELDGLHAGLTAALLEALAALCDAPEAEDAEDSARRIFTSLRWLGGADLSALTEQADASEQALLRDPAGVYPSMAKESRQAYRRRLAALAAKEGLPEHKAAQHVLALCREQSGLRAHVGYWLYREPLGNPAAQHRGGRYIAANVLIPLFFALLFGFLTGSVPAAVLLPVPLSELTKRLLDAVLLRSTPPAHLPRLELSGGVPDEGRTLCVVSALLTSEKSGPALAERLEQSRLLSRDAGRNLRFAVLADLPESIAETLPGAEDWIGAAKRAIDALNEKYGGGFYLLLRPRVKNREGRWTGRERKRGALLETMRYLRGEQSSITVAAGDAGALAGTRYLLALDSDTRLSPGAALALIGTALHPLNRPEIDGKKKIVRSGFGILAPRVGTELASACATDFARAFAGQGGTDPYGGACSELYMDLWGRGSFAGKGLIDIDAYLACMGDRVPENRMLSHDAVEGAFLHAGYVSEVEFTDGFPGGVCAYLRREERWTRGDWQNLPWLFRRGRALPDIERFRLYDSLRRSLLPVSALAAILCGVLLPGSGTVLAAAAALLAFGAELLQSGTETLLLPEADGRVRYHSAVLVGTGAALLRTLLRLILLPAEAFTCLAAILRALWRMAVSHRNLLQWQTAEQAGQKRNGLLSVYRELWTSAALGALLCALSPTVPGRAAGVIWLLSPLCAWLLSLPAAPERKLSVDAQETLREYARETYRFFEDFLTPEDHYLPPDNYQAQPPVGLAHRTSPTNIGLALLSALGAVDLGFTDADAAFRKIGGCLDTLEKLPKWHGHLYNWYDTRTLRPLQPRYISTVDSGNLCAALITLRAGLSEYGRSDLADRASALADAMDFAPLYDKEKKLFIIGRDPEKDGQPASWYDLMASEARLTAYLTVARGDVPRAHWRALSRAQVQLGPYRGLASWTGTAFEYLMPELLLPPERNSMLWESARFCLYAQRRRTADKKLPWGCSESAYASFDPSMTYRYKAHGCAALALKRGMDDELVVAPYSSFLALSIRPGAALRNLSALEKRGLRGPYGFWEAVDFTPDRCGEGGSIVRCVMAHHLGMSFLAAVNLLCGGIMRRRFLSDPAMAAYRGLLQEHVVVGGNILRRSEDGVRRTRPPQTAEVFRERSGEGTDYLRPDCCLLAGPAYSLLCAETGLVRPLWGAISPYVPGTVPTAREKGVTLFLQRGEQGQSLLPEPSGNAPVRSAYHFSTDAVTLETESEGLAARTTVSLAAEEIGELREIELTLHGDKAEADELVLRFRPLLARYIDYVNHPAFYGLGLSAIVREGCLLIRRLQRGKVPELWLCLAPSRECRYDLAPGAERGRAAGAEYAGETERFLSEGLVTAICPVMLAPDKTLRLRFALAMAHTASGALESAKRMLQAEKRADLPRSAAAVLGLTAAEIDAAFDLLPELCFPTAPQGASKQSDLWAFGISGDLPILCADYGTQEHLDAAKKLIDAHLFLCGCGADFDLVFLSQDGASYHKPLHTALTELLRRSGGELLRDGRGGVHIIEDSPEADCIRAAAARRIDLSAPVTAPSRNTGFRTAVPSPAGLLPWQSETRWEFDKSGTFRFYVNHSLPQRAWQNMLTNGRFGYLATDCGTGHLWYRNAREHQISPWLCAPCAAEGPERLMLRCGGSLHSLFASPEDGVCRVSYDFGSAVWERRFGTVTVRTTAFVPPDTDARVLLIEIDGAPADAEVHWLLPLQLSAARADARFCRIAESGGMFVAVNPRQMAEAAPFAAVCSEPLRGYTGDGVKALALCYDNDVSHSGQPVFATKFAPGAANVLVCGCEAPETLRELCSQKAARIALAKTRSAWRSRVGVLALQSPSVPLDRYMNGWAAYQTLAGRILGRCSIYQSGGAFGFRDQLQDAVNLLLFEPSLCRTQILRACARQYEEGDVQHWWHEGDGAPKGVRTRCSDDLLWLPWAAAEYAEKTGDDALLDEQTPFLASPPLREEEKDRYESPGVNVQSASVYAHCLRAIRCVMRRGVGAHGLLRIGSGDWNDGFDAVGGESVWLSWFFLGTARRFAALRPLPEREGEELRAFCEALRRSTEDSWCGQWYRRGWYADGRPLGAPECEECRIDSVAQSWAVLSGAGDPQRADTALTNALALLYDREHRLIRLFDPPFAGKEDPGYVRCYGPGFRENGGQYTHGALWLAAALLRSGRTSEGWELLSAMLPSARESRAYRGEPFVISADIYSAPGHEGEAGWTWYTGSAGWMLRIVTEELLGLRLRRGRLNIEPKLPPDWSGCDMALRGKQIGISSSGVIVDGQPVPPGGIAF